MLAHRIMGIMAHWKEYMGEENFYCRLSNLADSLQLIVGSCFDQFICIRVMQNRIQSPGRRYRGRNYSEGAFVPQMLLAALFLRKLANPP